MSGTSYVETSAVLRAVLEGDDDVLAELRDAERLVTSALTMVEAARGLMRAQHAARLSAKAQREAQGWLRRFERSCDVMALHEDVLERAKKEFPVEPIRSLDALHLASALAWSDILGDVAIVSVDRRIRDNAEALGLTLLPTSAVAAR